MTWYQLILQIISTNNLSFAEGSGKVHKTIFAGNKGFGVGIKPDGRHLRINKQCGGIRISTVLYVF